MSERALKSEHFGKLYGITRTIGGISTFLAVPIFKVVTSLGRGENFRKLEAENYHENFRQLQLEIQGKYHFTRFFSSKS